MLDGGFLFEKKNDAQEITVADYILLLTNSLKNMFHVHCTMTLLWIWKKVKLSFLNIFKKQSVSDEYAGT